jgi:hypothetical protein
MVHEPVHIVHLFTAHSVNFFEFQIIVGGPKWGLQVKNNFLNISIKINIFF